LLAGINGERVHGKIRRAHNVNQILRFKAKQFVWVIVDDTNRGSPVQTSKATFRSLEDAYNSGKGALEYWQRKTRRTHPPVDLAQPPVQKASVPRGTRRALTSPIYSRS
jgi:hypothetical protein